MSGQSRARRVRCALHHFVVNGEQAVGQRAPVRWRGFPTTAEAQDAASLGWRVTHGRQDMRWFFLTARASRSGRNRKAILVELDDPTLLTIGLWSLAVSAGVYFYLKFMSLKK